MMAGTPYETALYVLDSGRPGQTLLVLAGVHGDEPGASQAAEALVRRPPPSSGKLLILPAANRLAVEAGVRSTPELGDLNRVYFGGPNALPMTRMADAIVGAIEAYEVDVVIDLHESWDFFRPPLVPAAEGVNLASLGQTISPHRSEESRSLAKALVEAVNRKLRQDRRFSYHEFPAGHVDDLIVALPEGVGPEEIPRKSALDLPDALPDVASILVEVGQQQPLGERIRQQIAIVEALLRLLEDGEGTG